MKILFLDGLGSNPTGRKPGFLREHGFEVTYPILPEWDFDDAVQTARTPSMPTALMSSSGTPEAGPWR